MATAVVRATYIEQIALETFFTSLFGYGTCQVVWRRGRYQCTLPRALTSDEVQGLRTAVQVEHYHQF